MKNIANVHHLTMGVCLGALLALCAVLVARMDAPGRWPATLLLAPTYVFSKLSTLSSTTTNNSALISFVR